MDKCYCNNCGNYGHLYKNCRHPILSYGIILYHKCKETNEIKIVMIERKDSLSYIEFLRGKYSSIYNLDYLKLLFSRMSSTEIERICNNDFDTLWNDLWIHTETINYRIKKEYIKSKNSFNNIKKGYKIKDKLINFEYMSKLVENKYTLNEWEIPKGRRNELETNKECAIREFKEETNINESYFNIINNMIPIIEEYQGINKVRYKHIYYIGEANEKYDLKIDMKNKDQYTEIKDIKWLSELEAYDKIRDYDVKKKKIIKDFFDFIKNHNVHVTLEK
jgi:ADP-ribose pyrophosphatase YjhB (NUDIX family)